MIDAEHWDTVYTDRGERGVSWFTETPTCSLELFDAAHIGPERSMINVGAGASRLVDAILARGHTDVTALVTDPDTEDTGAKNTDRPGISGPAGQHLDERHGGRLMRGSTGSARAC
ncbi:MAG: hypothetical protein H0X35_04630 [Pseudonocardiales bacterium]|nr:hypothetical protein [Pseudonocardiales bacterium]